MNSYDPLLIEMKKNRQDASAKEFTIEFIENLEIIKELSFFTENIMSDYYYGDMISSYQIIPERISKEARRNFILGMNYFHISELLDAHDAEMPVYDDSDINLLIENRFDDLEYMLNDNYPELIDEYTKSGIKTEAYIYYKDFNNFRQR